MDFKSVLSRVRSLQVPEPLRPYWKPRIVAVAGLFLFAGGAGLALGSWQNLCATCPSVAQIRTWEPEQTSKLLTHDGELIVELGRERKTPISIHALPDYVPQAVIAIEDKRFYRHPGFDVFGLTRAALGQLVGQYRGGGSTITQQLARNMFEGEIGFAKRYTRKLRELQVALELERSYEKDEILESYLNEIYMGSVGYGFQAASRGYFGKNATEINVAEAALLAAILNRPGRYNPFTEPENAIRRRNLVLARMAEQDFITDEEAHRWQGYPLPAEGQGGSWHHGPAPYFEEWVRQTLDSRFGEEVYSGGLRVYTTLDLDMQKAAQEAMEWGWERIESQPNFLHQPYSAYDSIDSFEAEGQTPYLQGAFIALDPHTGAVRALIGGRDFQQSNFDRARQARRQAGSSFKPFVYTAAIASGIPASHIVEDQPVVLEQVDGTEWKPRNFDPEFLGPITIREGLRRSINMVAIKLGLEVGLETVAQTASRMGIRTEIERFPSTTIGAAEVIPLQVAEAYSGFATLGTKARPHAILRVENAEGEVIWEPRVERTQVLDSLVARIAVDMLHDAATQGTGAYHYDTAIFPDVLDRTGSGRHHVIPTAGKTGTTNDGTDTWFTGFTPNLVATIWFGMDRPQPIARPTRPQATGGFYAAPVWGRFAEHVYHGLPEELVDSASAGSTGSDASTDVQVAANEGGEGDSVDEENGSGAGTGMGADVGEVDGVWAGGLLKAPHMWPIPQGLITRQVDKRTGKLWDDQWCDNPEENRYTELYIPGTEPTEYCDDSRSRIWRIRRLPDASFPRPRLDGGAPKGSHVPATTEGPGSVGERR